MRHGQESYIESMSKTGLFMTFKPVGQDQFKNLLLGIKCFIFYLIISHQSEGKTTFLGNRNILLIAYSPEFQFCDTTFNHQVN